VARSNIIASATRDGGTGAAAAVSSRLHALDDFVAIEGLDQVVVGAELQSGQPVLHVAAAGDQHHAEAGRALHGLERLADFPAAALRHHHVEQHHVGKTRLRHGERFLTVVRAKNLGAERTQVKLEELDYVVIVVRDQNDRPIWHWGGFLRKASQGSDER
jgi:hypothetical protein